MKKRKMLLTALLVSLFALTPLTACNASVPQSEGDVSSSSDFIESGDNLSSELFPEPPEGETPSPEQPEEPTPDIPDQEPATPQKQYDRYIRCTGDSVNLRSGAGTGYSVLGTAEKGTTYQVLNEKNGWYKTQYKGVTAYLSASYAKEFSLEKSENAAVEEVLAVGYKLIGTKYVFGATRLHDGKGNLLYGFKATRFDCSSLTQYVFYYGAGVLLGTTTRAQVKQGSFVKRSNLQRGDCMYFTNDERRHLSGIERIGHVAIYLGEGYILHTASDFARIEKLTDKRWNNYVESRRFL